MNSSNDSEKSVVIESWVSADPSGLGWGVCANVPFGFIRRASRSTPRLMSFSAARNSGDLSAAMRASKRDESTVKMVVRYVNIAPVMGGNSVNSTKFNLSV